MSFPRTLSSISAAILLAFVAVPAHSTMPVLTDEPQPRNPSTCQKWAAAQSDDAIDVWGTMESGKSDKAEAIQRLTDYCLGAKMPEIVGFSGSVGTEQAYCHKHPRAQICAKPAQPAAWVGKWALHGQGDCKGTTGRDDGLIDLNVDSVGIPENGADIKKVSKTNGVDVISTVLVSGESEGSNQKMTVFVALASDAKHAMIAIGTPIKWDLYDRCASPGEQPN